MQSRYYSPFLKRFISLDDTGILEATQGEILGANLYAYCANNSIMYQDPTGYIKIKPVSWFGKFYSNYGTAINKWLDKYTLLSSNCEYGAVLFKVRIGRKTRYICGPTYQGFETKNWYTVINALAFGYGIGISLKKMARIAFVGYIRITPVGFVHTHPKDGTDGPSGPDNMMRFIPGLYIFALRKYGTKKTIYF